MIPDKVPGLDVLLREGQANWVLFTELVARLAAPAFATLVLAAVFYGLYRLGLILIQRFTRHLSEGPTVARALMTLLRLTTLALFLVLTASLFPTTVRFVGALARVYLIALLLLVGWDFVQWLLRRSFLRFGLDASLELLTKNVALAIWIAVGVYLIFQQFGINLLPILGGLGIAGIALGFAAQDLLSNLIAGITLLLDRPFHIGEWIRVNDWEGKVVRITLRTTRLRTRDNELISVPNSKIASSDVVNLSTGGPLRVRSVVGIAYQADLDRARSSILGAIAADSLVLADPAPRVALVELGDSSVNLDLIYWIDAESIERRPFIQQRVLEATKRALDAAGVEIPFPQRVLHLQSAAALGPLEPAREP